MLCEYTMKTTEKLNWIREYRETLCGLVSTHMVTIHFPRPPTGTRRARREKIFVLLREWNRAVLKKLFGKQFATGKATHAFLFVGFIEIGPLMAKEHVHLGRDSRTVPQICGDQDRPCLESANREQPSNPTC